MQNWFQFSKAQSPKLTPTKRFYAWYTTTSLNSACQHYPEIAQSYTLAALMRLSTTTHNRLTEAKYHQITRKNSAFWQITPLHIYLITLVLFRYTATRSTVACEHALSRSLVCRPAQTQFSRQKKSYFGSKFVTCIFALVQEIWAQILVSEAKNLEKQIISFFVP